MTSPTKIRVIVHYRDTPLQVNWIGGISVNFWDISGLSERGFCFRAMTCLRVFAPRDMLPPNILAVPGRSEQFCCSERSPTTYICFSLVG